jgi:CubicO group peptidase (beta-lactamase class C family)
MERALSRRRFLASVGTSTAAAAAGVSTVSADTDPPTTAADQVAVESTLDDLIPASLDEHDVPGAIAAVVKGEETITKGYGVADSETEADVDPGATAFRIGSASKPVTATALMDRIQRGAIDPSAPIAEYVGSEVAPERSVTLSELVTHRGGFESSNRGLWIPDDDALRPLSAYLRDEPQAQVREPGTVGAYSNFGYALAGQILAATADEPFHRAVDDELLGPAGMDGSSFRQPLPDSVAESHATGHGPTESYQDGEFPFVGLRPAGSLSATADDMARFLRLHVDDGRLDGERVLAPGTIDAMHEQWATHHDRLDGMGFGLIEETRSGTRTLWHNGATLSFYSHLVVVPEHDFGLFVAFNAPAGSAAAGDVVDEVLDEALPDHEAEPRGPGSPEEPPTRADDLTGTYRSLRQSYTWHDRATSVLNAGTVTVGVADDGALVTERGDSRQRWVEVEPLVFEQADGDRRIAFGERDGEVTYLFRGGSPTAYGRVDGLANLRLHGALALCTLLGVLSSVVGWPGGALVRRLRAERAGAAEDVTWVRLLGSRSNRAKLIAGGAAVAILAGLVLILIHFAASPYLVLSDPPVTFRAVFAVPLLGLVGTVGSLGYAGRLLVTSDGSRLERLHYGVVTASLAALCWLLWYWNLLFPPP